MGIFNKQRTDGASYDGQGEERKGSIDVIKYNGEPDDIVWKFPYENISTAAQLVVNQSQEAIFLKGGDIADIFGPGTKTLSANNIPILQKLINLPFGGKTPFTAEVWFINKRDFRGDEALKFGTDTPVSVRDVEHGAFVPIRMRGIYGIRVIDSTLLLHQFVGTLHLLNTETLRTKFRGIISSRLAEGLRAAVKEERIPILDIETENAKIEKYVRGLVVGEFERYGIELTTFDLTNISADKESQGFKDIQDAIQTDISSAALARKRQREGYNYQQERQLDVMETAAGNEGGAGQMMGAGMGLGMGFGVGGAFGQQMGNVAGVMNQSQTPPPPPQTSSYHVLINNQQMGPYDLAAIGQMVQNGQITQTTHVWKAGMPQWAKVADCAELQPLFPTTPPPPPIL